MDCPEGHGPMEQKLTVAGVPPFWACYVCKEYYDKDGKRIEWIRTARAEKKTRRGARRSGRDHRSSTGRIYSED